MASESELLWLIARLYMTNRRGWGQTSQLVPLQDEAAAILSAAIGRDVTQTEDSEIEALLAPHEAKG